MSADGEQKSLQAAGVAGATVGRPGAQQQVEQVPASGVIWRLKRDVQRRDLRQYLRHVPLSRQAADMQLRHRHMPLPEYEIEKFLHKSVGIVESLGSQSALKIVVRMWYSCLDLLMEAFYTALEKMGVSDDFSWEDKQYTAMCCQYVNVIVVLNLNELTSDMKCLNMLQMYSQLVGQNIIDFIFQHSYLTLSPNQITHTFVWKLNGNLDQEQTALNIINFQFCSPANSFRLASKFCFVEKIQTLWQRIRDSYIYDTDWPKTVWCKIWACTLENDISLFELPNITSGMSLQSYALQTAVLKQNIYAIRYYSSLPGIKLIDNLMIELKILMCCTFQSTNFKENNHSLRLLFSEISFSLVILRILLKYWPSVIYVPIYLKMWVTHYEVSDEVKKSIFRLASMYIGQFHVSRIYRTIFLDVLEILGPSFCQSTFYQWMLEEIPFSSMERLSNVAELFAILFPLGMNSLFTSENMNILDYVINNRKWESVQVILRMYSVTGQLDTLHNIYKLGRKSNISKKEDYETFINRIKRYENPEIQKRFAKVKVGRN